MAVQPQEDEPQPPLLSGLQLLLERPYVRVDIGIMRPKGLYRPHGMDNSAMIAPAEDSSDFRKGTRGHFLGEVHRDRKSVVEGKSVSVRVDLGGRRIIKKNKDITDIYERVRGPYQSILRTEN